MQGRLGKGFVTALILVVILVAALGLRLWGSGFGLPAYTRYHPDEHALVERAAAILWTGDWNLQRFNYPPFYAYLQAGSYAAYFLWGAAQGNWNQILPFVLPRVLPGWALAHSSGGHADGPGRLPGRQAREWPAHRPARGGVACRQLPAQYPLPLCHIRCHGWFPGHSHLSVSVS